MYALPDSLQVGSRVNISSQTPLLVHTFLVSRGGGHEMDDDKVSYIPYLTEASWFIINSIPQRRSRVDQNQQENTRTDREDESKRGLVFSRGTLDLDLNLDFVLVYSLARS